jgi:hypothetical protein
LLAQRAPIRELSLATGPPGDRAEEGCVAVFSSGWFPARFANDSSRMGARE